MESRELSTPRDLLARSAFWVARIACFNVGALEAISAGSSVDQYDAHRALFSVCVFVVVSKVTSCRRRDCIDQAMHIRAPVDRGLIQADFDRSRADVFLVTNSPIC